MYLKHYTNNSLLAYSNSHLFPYCVEGDNSGNAPLLSLLTCAIECTFFEPLAHCKLTPFDPASHPLLLTSSPHFRKFTGPAACSCCECFNSWYFCGRTQSVIGLFRRLEDKGRMLSLLPNRSTRTTMPSAGTLPPWIAFSVHLNWGTWESFFRIWGQGKAGGRERKRYNFEKVKTSFFSWHRFHEQK